LLQFDGIITLATLVLMAYCIFDVIRTPDGTTENLPKLIWLLLVIFIPLIGSLAWLLLGRPRNASFHLRTESYRNEPTLPPPPPVAPPPVRDSEEYQRKREEALRRYHAEREEDLQKREEELRRREEELRRREQGDAS
jgi:hypothetical protein